MDSFRISAANRAVEGGCFYDEQERRGVIRSHAGPTQQTSNRYHSSNLRVNGYGPDFENYSYENLGNGAN